MAKTRNTPSTTCASCGTSGPIQLGPDSICAACLSAKAWKDHASEALVIGEAEIAQAVKASEARPGRYRWVPHALLGVLSALGLGAVGVALARVLAPVSIRSLYDIHQLMAETSSDLLWSGVVLLLVGIIGAVILRRTQQIRSFTLLAVHSLALVAGIAAGITGYVYGLSAHPDHIPFPNMPPKSQLEGFALTDAIRLIADSTVVVVAPDKDGDARFAALGTGAVIRSEGNQAWIVTCSHVAIPHVSTGAIRDPKETHPLWINFSDGRGAEGTIIWAAPPPLDVAIVSVTIESPPPAVEISPSTKLLGVSSPVIFIPNPVLHGWQVHHGVVDARKTHDTPAGEFALVHTSLPVVPGDSGSGLYDEEGRLMGLNTWTRYDHEGSHGISLPSEVLRSMEGAIKNGTLEGLDLLVPASAPSHGTGTRKYIQP